MGRELRMVPPNWKHPTDDEGDLKPMHDENFETRFEEWLADFDRIRIGNLTDIERRCYESAHPLAEWLLDEGMPRDPALYRPWKDEEATWFQVWENVTEGTPVTPPFATKAELVDYLVEQGDFWQQHARTNGVLPGEKPRRPGYSREAAEAFVASGYAPSMVISNGKMAMGIDAATLMENK